MAPPRSGNPALVARIEAILQGPTWPSIYRSLFLVGMRFTKRNDVEAEELVGKALANVYSGAKTGKGRLWNPDKHPDFKVYMGGVVKGVFLDERKRPDQQRHTTIDPADYEQHPNPQGDGKRLLSRDAKRQRGEERIAKIAGDLDEVAKDVFLALVVRGDYDRNALAAKHGCDVEAIDAARRRAAARTKAVVDADPDSDDEPVSSGPAPVPAKPAPRHDSDEQDE